MATENEPAKLLLPYLQRADELQKHDHLVAYYCRLYAMERGLRISQKERTKTTNAILVSLMNQLEKDKKSLKLGPDDNLHLEGFALSVFEKADKQDRAGRADLSTAKTFYAASIFFEILNQFGDVQAHLEQKQKYAAWKAVDIRKAIKEGKKPEPGPPVDDKDPSLPSNTEAGTYDMGVRRTVSDADRQAPESEIPSSDPSLHPHDKFYTTHHSHSSPTLPNPQSFPQSPHFDDKQPQYNHQPNFINPSPSYSSINFNPPPPENPPYSHPYPNQPFSKDPFDQLPQNFHPYEASSPPYPLPNSQRHPSFTETASPVLYQNSEGSSFSPSKYQQNAGGDLRGSEAMHHGCATYEPAPERIAEAHKAARFAVGALAFDDAAAAVEFLRKSLDLLTNPLADAR